MLKQRVSELESDRYAILEQDVTVKSTLKNLDAAIIRLNDRLDTMDAMTMPDAAETCELRTQLAALVLRWQQLQHSLLRKGSSGTSCMTRTRVDFVSSASDRRASKVWLAFSGLLVLLLLAGDLVLLFGGLSQAMIRGRCGDCVLTASLTCRSA